MMVHPAPSDRPDDADLAAPPDWASMHQRERNQQLVQVYEIEIFAEQFPRTMCIFFCLYIIVSLATVALLVWLVVSFASDFEKDCHVPLQAWVIGDFASTFYHTVHGCCVASQRDSHALPGFWSRVHYVVILLVDFLWLMVGAVMVHIPGSCSETAPRLHMSVKLYTHFSVVFSVVIHLHAAGIHWLLGRMMRSGMLRTANAAPKGTLARQRVTKFDPELEVFKKNPECCICLASFDRSQEIRATACCHAFHTRCLSNWLQVSKTCPLCRQDLSQDGPDTPAVGRALAAGAQDGHLSGRPGEAAVQ